MTYNFDEIIDRKGTYAYKTDLCVLRFGTDDILPLWVADMDFRTPDFIFDAIKKRCEHEILGYTIPNRSYFKPIIDWVDTKHSWQIQNNWMGFVPGIVPAMAISVLAFTDVNDKVIVQTPVYPPFFSVVENNDRELVLNELLLKDGQYRMNFEQLRQQVSDPKVKLLLLCSPHNPGGRVWSKDELNELSEICAANNVVVVSDEIHADLVLPGFKHTPFATVSETAKHNSITLMAPSKTFNMAGLVSSFYIIPDNELSATFKKQQQALEELGGNIFAYEATKAAYENGADWLHQMINYIQGNVEFVNTYLQEQIPQVKAIIPEASFLIWLDFSELNMSDKEVQDLLVKKAKLGLNPGPSFGPGGSGFHRLNVGCSRLVLEKAMKQLQEVIDNL